MKYFLIRTDSDPTVIGVKNGVSQVEIDLSSLKQEQIFEKFENFFNSQSYWSHKSRVPDFNFSLNSVKSLPKAILTDFLSYREYLIGCPFIISERVVEILKKFKLQEHYLYNVILNHKGIIYNSYKLIYFPLLDYDIVNIKESVFFNGSSLLGKKLFTFPDSKSFLEYVDTKPYFHSEKITLNEQIEGLDFFVLRFGGIYISEKLKAAIEDAKLSGIKILEPKEPEIY